MALWPASGHPFPVTRGKNGPAGRPPCPVQRSRHQTTETWLAGRLLDHIADAVEHRGEWSDGEIQLRRFHAGMRAGWCDRLGHSHRRAHPLEVVSVECRLQFREFVALLMLGVLKHRFAQLGEFVDELLRGDL